MTASDAGTPKGFLREVASGVRRPLVISLLGGIVRQAGFLLAPVLLSRVIDQGVLARDQSAVVLWCGVLLAAAIMQFLGLCVWEQFANRADAEAGVTLRGRLRSAIVSGSAGTLGSGDLMSRAGRDVDLIRVWVHGLPTWGVIGVTIVVLVPGVASLDPWLLLVALGSVPALAALCVIYPKRFEQASAHAAAAHGLRANVVEHIVASGPTLRGIGAEQEAVRQHELVSADLAGRTVRASGVLARWTALGEGVPRIATALGVVVGAWAALEGRLSPGGIVTFSGWMATVGVAVQVGLMRYTQSVEAVVGARRLLPVCAGGPGVIGDGAKEREAGAVEPSSGATASVTMRLEQVVAVPGGSPVSSTVRSGQLVAVTGPVACGKSTLLQMMSGGVRPEVGRIESSPKGAVQGDAARLVSQRPMVAGGSIRDNMRLGYATGDEAADDARFLQVLHDVGLAEELSGRAHPTTLDLDLGDAGRELSGGQRQRLALARALVAQPRVVLVDDVTSAVDRVTARRLVSTLGRAAHDGALVVATGHDADLLAAADVVITMERTRTEELVEGGVR